MKPEEAETSIFPNFSILLSYIHSSIHFSSFIQTFIQSTKNNRIKQREKVKNNVIKGPKSANVIGLQSNPSKCHKKLRKYHKTLLPWTPTPPLGSRHLLHHAPLRLDALHYAKNLWITKHIRMPIALSTLALMLLMIWYGSGGCLAHCCSTITSS